MNIILTGSAKSIVSNSIIKSQKINNIQFNTLYRYGNHKKYHFKMYDSLNRRDAVNKVNENY